MFTLNSGQNLGIGKLAL